MSILLTGTLAGEVARAEPTPLRATEPAATPLAPAAGPAASPAKPDQALASGKVLETMDVPGYTYAHVETTSGQRWIAGPQTALKVGDIVSWPDGTEMKNFPSKSLGRTFESILFTDRLVVGAATTGGASSPHAGLSANAEGPVVSGVSKAEGGVTVAEIFDRRAELDGKEIVVRGKVVLNKDFGFNYRYDVMIEDAKLVVE